jgi:hypothetical protein
MNMRKPGIARTAAAAVTLLLLAAGIGHALNVSGVKVAPTVVKPGDNILITVKVDDPTHEAARVAAVSVEFTRMYDRHIEQALNDGGRVGDARAGDGVWARRFYVPAAPSGLYHFEIALFDAAGSRITIATAPAATTAALEIRDAGTFSSPQLRAAAGPWRPTAQIRKLAAMHRRPGEPFKFVAMGDSCYHPDVFTTFLKIVAGLQPDFSVDIGDIVDGEDDPWEWSRLLTQIGHINWPFFVVLGNHDIWPWRTPPGGKGSPQGKLFEELFGPTDYYFDHGGFRFVAVDTGRFAISPERLRWLDKVLDTPLRKIVFMHVPPVVITKWAQFGPGNTFSVGAQDFTDLVAAKRVERVYVGHLHILDVADYKGVRYVITGAVGQGSPGRDLRRNSRHLILVEAGPGPLREIIYLQDGTNFVLDPEKWIAGLGQ